jgi:hypothetical protein
LSRFVRLVSSATQFKSFHVVWQEIDRDSLQIERRWEEEGTQQIHSKEALYEKLGLKNEDEKDRKAREEADERRQPSLMANENVNEQFCGDHVPDEMASLCDWKKPIMELGSRYKDMATFRLAMRQYAIKKKFELGIEAST